MEKTGSVKVPNGKLVRVDLECDDRIHAVRITGDFFLEPPEALSELEAAIEGKPPDVSREALRESIEDVEAELIGFDADDLAEATLEAVR